MTDWTADQQRYIEWLASPRMSRTPPTQGMVAEEIGVDAATLWRWSKLPGFDEEVKRLIRGSLGKKLPDLYGALIREAEKGSYQHLQLALEMTGEYTRKQHNINDSNLNGELVLRFVEEEVIPDDDP